MPEGAILEIRCKKMSYLIFLIQCSFLNSSCFLPAKRKIKFVLFKWNFSKKVSGMKSLFQSKFNGKNFGWANKIDLPIILS